MEKKILLISDAEHFSAGTSRFLTLLAQQYSLTVKGQFIDTAILAPLVPLPYGPVDVATELLEHNEEQKMECRKIFGSDCGRSGISYSSDANTLAWIDEDLGHESRFVDLILISEHFSNSSSLQGKPDYYLESVLQRAECPVIVVPESFQWVDRIAVAYDGSRECMYALRTFLGLLPDLSGLPVELVHFPNRETGKIPDKERLKDYVHAHFDASFVSALQVDHPKAVVEWLKTKKNVLLVAGSYGRTGLSSLLRKSFASHIISTNTCPVFIAHTPHP